MQKSNMADFDNLDAIEDEDELESLVRNDPRRLWINLYNYLKQCHIVLLFI